MIDAHLAKLGLSWRDLSFSTSEVTELTGATPAQLRYWQRTRLVWPTFSSDRARQVPRDWNVLDLMVIRLVVELKKRMPARLVRRELQRLGRGNGIARLLLRSFCPAIPVVFRFDSDGLSVLEGEEAWNEIRKPGQRAYVLQREIVKPMREATSELFQRGLEVLSIIREPTAAERASGQAITEELIGYRR